jgi:Type IV secretion system pilin
MIKLLQKTFLALVVAATLILPHVAFAATTSCDELKAKFTNSNGADTINALPAYCNVESVYNKFINLALFAAGIVAVVAIIYGGYTYMTAGANDSQRKKGRDVLTWAVLGLIVVILATVLVNAVINAIVT